jgi:hypothetical protein
VQHAFRAHELVHGWPHDAGKLPTPAGCSVFCGYGVLFYTLRVSPAYAICDRLSVVPGH